MNHVHDGGGSSVGINITELEGLISDLDTAQGDIEAFTTTYRSKFSSSGVSTANITTIENVAEWVGDQLPMLRRRLSLAVAADAQGQTGFSTAGAGDLPWDSQEEAAQNGQQDAETLLNGLRPGDDVPPEVYELMREHANDPDYMAAFFEAAGPLGVNVMRVGALDQGLEYDRTKMVPLSYAMATASYRIDFSQPEWTDPRTGIPADVMAPLLQYGHFNTDVLTWAMDELGGAAVPPVQPQNAEIIMNALARNPVAAGTWYADNPEKADILMQGRHVLMSSPELREAFRNVMDSATVRVTRIDQNLGEQNTLTLLEHVAAYDDVHVTEEFQQWFGELVERHIDDVYDSTTSTVPGYFDELREGRDGVEAPADIWAAFVEEAMRDPDTAAELSLIFENEYHERYDRASREESKNDGEKDGNNLSIAQSNFFSDWFLTRFTNVQNAHDLDAEEWNEGFDKAVDYLFSVTDPKGLAKDITKDLIKAFVNAEPPSYDVDTDWATSWSELVRRQAGLKWEHYDGEIPPVTVENNGTSITWDGDTGFYEELYGGRFTDDNGNILSYEEISEDPDAMRAYMNWLEDPAIQNVIWNDVGADFPGGRTTP